MSISCPFFEKSPKKCFLYYFSTFGQEIDILIFLLFPNLAIFFLYYRIWVYDFLARFFKSPLRDSFYTTFQLLGKKLINSYFYYFLFWQLFLSLFLSFYTIVFYIYFFFHNKNNNNNNNNNNKRYILYRLREKRENK